MNSCGPLRSTPPIIVLTPNGRTEEYNVYACTYMDSRLTTSYTTRCLTSDTCSTYVRGPYLDWWLLAIRLAEVASIVTSTVGDVSAVRLEA